jgi:hypothetical protein
MQKSQKHIYITRLIKFSIICNPTTKALSSLISVANRWVSWFPLPLAFIDGVLLAWWELSHGKDLKSSSSSWMYTAMEWSILMLCYLGFFITSRLNLVYVKAASPGTTQE